MAQIHQGLGATMVSEAGWELPGSYGDEDAERSAIRDGLAIADITPRGKIDVRGQVDGALATVVDDTVARLAPGWAMVLTPPGGEAQALPALEAAAGAATMVTDATHLFASYALCGPRLPELLARTSGWDLATLAPGDAIGAPIVDVRAVMVRRDLSDDVLEVYVATELARYVWEALAGAVSGLDGRPVGWQALRAEGWA
jgi:heterotetrameric sarcosine oxidase gamma subunit